MATPTFIIGIASPAQSLITQTETVAIVRCPDIFHLLYTITGRIHPPGNSWHSVYNRTNHMKLSLAATIIHRIYL